MSFLWPAGLWFAALLPAIVVLYFLKLRRSPKVVPSTYLWKRTIDEYRVNRPFQKFQNQLLLWLQLVIACLLILALARPFVRMEQAVSDVHVYLVDQSASMNAAEEGGTRLELAKRFLRDVVDGKRASDRVAIIGFSDRSYVAAPLTTERRALREAVDALQPTDRPTNLNEAWQTALSIARQFDRSDVYLVSDGGFGGMDALTQANATVHYVPIGKSADNLGVVQLEARESAEDRQAQEIFAQVQNARPRAATTRVELYLNGGLADAQNVTIAAGDRRGVIFRRPAADEGVAEVRLTERDALAVDDRAWVLLRATEPVKVLIVGDEDLFLREVLASDPDVELSRLSAAEYGPLEGRLPPCDLVVFDGVAPKAFPRAAVLCLGAAPATEGFTSAAPVEHPKILTWDAEHPLTRFVNFGNLSVAKMTPGGEPPWMQSLVSSDSGALIAAGERGGLRLVVVRFGLLESDWPLRVSFPLFMANAVRWAKDVDTASGEGFVRPGQPMVVPVPAGLDRGTVSLPGGGSRAISAGEGRRVTIAETERPGVYRIRWEGRKRDAVHVVNLLDAAESNIAVPPAVTMGGERVLGTDERTLVQRELTTQLLLAALAFLLVEWLYYQFHRGG